MGISDGISECQVQSLWTSAWTIYGPKFSPLNWPSTFTHDRPLWTWSILSRRSKNFQIQKIQWKFLFESIQISIQMSIPTSAQDWKRVSLESSKMKFTKWPKLSADLTISGRVFLQSCCQHFQCWWHSLDLSPISSPHRNPESLHGIHCHLGSTISKLEPIRDCVTRLKLILESIRPLINISNPVINVGGGLGIDYHRYKGPGFNLRTSSLDGPRTNKLS